jgi:hypothetical protein
LPYHRGGRSTLVQRFTEAGEPFGTPIQPFEEVNLVEEIKAQERYEFYNVLWVEWVDSLAYRKGAGRVWIDAWERQHLKTMNVCLVIFNSWYSVERKRIECII